MCLGNTLGAQARVETDTYTIPIMCEGGVAGGVAGAVAAMGEGGTNSTLREKRAFPGGCGRDCRQRE